MSLTFTPRLEIYPTRVAENARAILQICHSQGIQVACVGKVVCAHPEVMRTLEECGADMLADSRLENLAAIRRNGTSLPLMLLRIPTPSRIKEVVEIADISLVSDTGTVSLLSEAALHTGRTHQVIMMVDLGDLREGIWPDRLIESLRAIINLPALEVIGLGTNLACYGGGRSRIHKKCSSLLTCAMRLKEYWALNYPFCAAATALTCRCCWRAESPRRSTCCASAKRFCWGAMCWIVRLSPAPVRTPSA